MYNTAVNQHCHAVVAWTVVLAMLVGALGVEISELGSLLGLNLSPIGVRCQLLFLL